MQDADEYSAAERLYLSPTAASRSAIILAASRGRGLEAVTVDRPKVMLPIAGKPLLRWLVDGFKKEGINDITVVAGYRADAIDTAGIKLVVNERHADTGELTSLACAVDKLDADTVIAYGDLLFRSYVLRDLLDSKQDFSVIVDSLPTTASNRTVRDFVYCSRSDDRGLFGTPVLLEHVAGDSYGGREPQGRFIGMLNVSRSGLVKLKAVLAQLRERADFAALDMPALLNALIAEGAAIEVSYVHGHWRGVNDLEDFRRAVDFAHAQIPYGSAPGSAESEAGSLIEAHHFVEAARQRGFQWYAGVPCSYLTPFINYVLQDHSLTYLSMANEGDAVALIAGVALGAGSEAPRRGVAMMQNSGLGNAVSPLTSLTWTFRLPQLLIVTWRGQPGVADEPQHALMGPITPALFDSMQIPWELFPTEADAIGPALDRATAHMDETGRPYALLMQKGSVADYPLKVGAGLGTPHAPSWKEVRSAAKARGSDVRPSRQEALRQVVEHTPPESTAVLASTGFCGRELYAVADRPNHLYMVGSMGCVVPLALGLALSRPDLNVVALDGDGAALMRLGAFCTVGAYGPANLQHLLLDNGAHDSTGGQATVSPHVAFAQVAAACGYADAVETDNVAEIAAWLKQAPQAGARFARLLMRSGTPRDLPRPSITPVEVKSRLMRHFGRGAGVH